MQATMNSNALAPSLRLQFARRGYMVRSEKRRRPSGTSGSGHSGGKPPRRRRTRAGFFYKLLTILLLLILWPVGLIPLWKRKLRWSGLTKVFTSVITLMACILLIGSALTVKTDNATVTAVQNSVNGFLDVAADSVVDFSVTLGGRVQKSLEALDELNFLYRRDAMLFMADAIDNGVEIAQDFKADVGALFSASDDEPEDAEAPETETEAPDNETAAPDDAAGTDAPDGTDAPEASDAPESTAQAAPTSAPAAEIAVNAEVEELPVYIPETTPDPQTGAAVISGMLSRSGILEADALPTAAPEPEADSRSFAVKPAAQATVYFNTDSGRFYHMASVCGSMQNAETHTLAEVAGVDHEPCTRCAPPARELLEETYIVWLDENDVAHLSDECASFEGQWRIVTAEDANAQGREGCPDCRANGYLALLANGLNVTLENTQPEDGDDGIEPADAPTAAPTPEPSPESTPEPTPEPSPQVVTPRETLKPAAEATVYHTGNGRFYHMGETCTNMTGARPYTLAQSVADGYRKCNTCSAPDPAFMDGLSLWKDEDNVCHISDECEYFVGVYALIDRDDALSDGLVGCSHCGAVDYLIPFTVMNPTETLNPGDDHTH